jgi:RNA polymerase sigma-70 factor (ECF subfamily)
MGWLLIVWQVGCDSGRPTFTHVFDHCGKGLRYTLGAVPDAAAKSLIDQAVAGDADALTALLREHGPEVARRLQIGPMWQSMLEADDVMQVTYIEAFMQISRFDASRGMAFRAWLERIAQNNLRDAIRGLSRQKQPQPRDRVQIGGGPAGGDSYDGLLEMLGTTSATPSRAAGRQETQALMERAIKSLPADYANVIRLYDLEGKPIDEVASTLERSPGAVHMLRARAHDCLRQALGTESMFFSTPA